MVGGGTLWIKLNISEDDVFEEHKKHEDGVMEVRDKDEDEDIEVEIPKNNDDDDNRRRICHVCNKGFSSGKALGGHMRIHVQAAKKHLLSGKKSKKPKPPPLFDSYYKQRDYDGEEEEEKVDLENYKNNDDELLPVCSVCGKDFPSMKSLFGHMRCHPERAWRGIQPPHNLRSDHDEIDRKTVKVPGWSVTAKRGGRKRNAEEEDEDELQDAVHHLMLLANGDSVESGLTGGDDNNKHEELLEKTNSNSLTSKSENEELAAAYHVSDSKIIQIIDNTRRRKKMKLKHLDSVQDYSASPASEKFKCNTCGRIFATHQALGGHKSSHNKFRMVIQNSSDVTYNNNVGGATSEEEAAGSSSKLLADGKLATQLINSPAEFSHITTTGPRYLDFDLNEFPPDDHEDELSALRYEQGLHIAHTLSSYDYDYTRLALRELGGLRVKHYYRKSNRVADLLVKEAPIQHTVEELNILLVSPMSTVNLILEDTRETSFCRLINSVSIIDVNSTYFQVEPD